MVTTRQRMDTGPDPKTKLTYEDYAKTPDDERWELIDGELIPTASPTVPHQSVDARLGAEFSTLVKQGLGSVFHSIDVVLSPHNTFRSDLIFVSSERAGIITHANIQGAPDLMVEIRSPSTAGLDEVTKRELYERYGVKEYWLADPEAQTVTVLLLGENGYETVGIYAKGDTLTSPTLEGFIIDLNEIFA
ncbi:MAG: Uma2 family endonuclease [Dehalococcoidia bacterium]|nr:Uma2 family endonuclease [Dehalococcoidia bacterium]